MAMTVSELQVKVGADVSQAESGLSSLGGKIGSIGGGIATAFGTAAVAGIAAVGGAFAASASLAAGFESQMSAIKAVSGASAAEMAALQGKALELGAATSFSASEAAQGIEELIKAGVSVGDVLGGGAAAALNLAAAGAISVKDAAEITSNALNQFGLSGDKAAAAADLIAGAANASAIDVSDFKFSLAAVGAVANAVGLSFDDTAVAIALMGQAGIKGSDAGTSLKTMLLNLQPTTKEQISLFRQLGLITADGANQFFDASGQIKGFDQVAGILKSSLSGLTDQQRLMALETIFGSDAIRAAAVFVDQGTEGFNEMAAAMSKVTAESVAAERLNNLKGDIEQLTGSLETAGIKIGMAFLPGLRSITQGATEMVNQAAPLLESFAADAASAIQEASRQIADAWRTAKQAFAGEWLPSTDIPPFVNAIGQVSTKLGELADFLGKVSDKAGQMGAWDDFKGGFDTLAKQAKQVGDRLGEMGEALGRLNTAAGGAEANVNRLATAVKIVGAGFQVWANSMAGLIDSVLTLTTQAINTVTVLGSVSKAVNALARGDLPGYEAATKDATAGVSAMITTHKEFSERSSERSKQSFAAIRSAAEAAMPAVVRSVEDGMARVAGSVESKAPEIPATLGASLSNAEAVTSTSSGLIADILAQGMASATANVETGGRQMATAAEGGAAQTVAAVQAQSPAMAAAGTELGTGMAAGIETAAPQMETAASQGASGAVAAVRGQEGAASSAGSSVGDAIGAGIKAGLSGWAGSIASAAAGLVTAAIAAARGAAEARSPSKKTEKLGKDLAEGLEIGLNSSGLGAEMQKRIRDFIDASRAYIPVAGQIKRVEDEIADIRERSQVDAMFRATRMIDIDSETLRLKEAQVRLERDLLPLRQDLARASREVADIERGSLPERQNLIEMDGQRKALRLQEIDLEKQLIGLDRDSKKAKTIQEQIDKLREQDRALTLETERIRLTNEVAATGAKVRREALDDAARGQETVIQLIKDQIDTLDAERAVFNANEAVIKDATENEIAYRNRLIAVFQAEGKPLADRIAAGLALVDQLEKEGKISKELADKLREGAKEAGVSSSATTVLGNAAATAAPQMDAAARKAAEMAEQARRIAEQAKGAADKVDALSKSLGKLPDWFTPKGSGDGGGLFKPRAMGDVGSSGGQVMPALAGSSPLSASGGGLVGGQTLRIDVAIGGRVAEQIYVEGRELAIRRGRS